MSEFEKLNIILAARDREFARAMEANTRRVERFTRQSNKGLSSTSQKFDALGFAAKRAGPLLAALSAGALVAKLRSTVAALDDIGKTADRIGLTTDALQLLRTVAESSGVEQTALDTAMEKFSKGLGEATMGIGQARIALAALNLDAGELADMPLDVALGSVADAMNGVEGTTEKTALAMQLFGRGGSGMVNLLREGAEGMATMQDEARALGIVIDENLIRSAEDAQTQLDLMSRVINANLSNALIELAPLLVTTATNIAAVSKAVAGFFASQGSFLQPLLDADGLRDLASEYAGLEDELTDATAAQAAYNANVEQFGVDSDQAAAWSIRRANAENVLREAIEKRNAEENATNRAVTGIEGLSAQTEELREQARLRSLSAEDVERARITDEMMAREAQIFNDILASGREITAETRAEVYGMGEAFEAAAIAASKILTPDAPATPSAGSSAGLPDVKTIEDFDAAIAQAQEMMASGRLEAFGLSEAVAVLNASFAAGEISGEAYETQLDKISDAFAEIESAADRMESGAVDALTAIFTGSKFAKDAVGELLAEWGKMALQAAFKPVMGGVFDGLAGAIFGGASFDGGGNTGNGARSGGLDGKGGFMAMLHPKETVIDHTRQGAGSGGGGTSRAGAMSITISLDGARGNAEIAEIAETATRRGLAHFERSVLPLSIRNQQRDPRRIG